MLHKRQADRFIIVLIVVEYTIRITIDHRGNKEFYFVFEIGHISHIKHMPIRIAHFIEYAQVWRNRSFRSAKQNEFAVGRPVTGCIIGIGRIQRFGRILAHVFQYKLPVFLADVEPVCRGHFFGEDDTQQQGMQVFEAQPVLPGKIHRPVDQLPTPVESFSQTVSPACVYSSVPLGRYPVQDRTAAIGKQDRVRSPVLLFREEHIEPVQYLGIGKTFLMQLGVDILLPQKFVEPVVSVVVAHHQYLFNILADRWGSIG